MDYDRLETYATMIMIPPEIRKYLLRKDWETSTMPTRTAEKLIEYSRLLGEMVNMGDVDSFRNFISRRKEIHGEELEEILRLKDNELKAVAELIKMERDSVDSSAEGSC